MNSKKGITLVALVVTIIVLLILAGITISLTIGKDSVTSKTTNSKVDARYASVIDRVKARETELTVEKYKGNSGETQKEFVEKLIADGFLVLDNDEDSYKSDYSVVYIGKLEDGKYKYTVEIVKENTNTIETGPDRKSTRLNSSH